MTEHAVPCLPTEGFLTITMTNNLIMQYKVAPGCCYVQNVHLYPTQTIYAYNTLTAFSHSPQAHYIVTFCFGALCLILQFLSNSCWTADVSVARNWTLLHPLSVLYKRRHWVSTKMINCLSSCRY